MKNEQLRKRLYISSTELIVRIKSELEQLNNSVKSVENMLEVANELAKLSKEKGSSDGTAI